MKLKDYTIVRGDLTEKDSVARGPDLYYLCSKCGDAIPSIPRESSGCKCGNVFIDKEYFRLDVENYTQFKLVRKK